ncbi:MAG: histidine phosphatase family protein [Eubacteriales bacterium]|nr:histidine phosphatase family protein [Eubacteriales bacterium]
MRNYTLHLIRHGLIQANLDGLFVGSGTDAPLIEEGRRRLAQLREDYGYPPVEKLYTSPMKRCLETCEIIYPDTDYTIVTDLREISFGAFEGKSVRQLLETDPDVVKYMDPEADFTPEGGESGRELGNRALGALDEILQDMMKNGIHEAAAVSHGVIISILLAAVGYPKKDALDWSSDNGCGFTLTTTPALWMRDGAVEVVDIVPKGYLDGKTEEDRDGDI